MADYLGRSWTRRELLARVGSIEQLAGVQALTLTDGRGRGVRVLEVRTGSGLAFTVLVDRALDIGALSHGGVPLTWTSPSGLVHPSHYDPAGKGWVRSFGGGLVVTCGLDQFGSPSADGEEAFGLHGRVSNTGAEQVSHESFWDGDEYLIQVRGRVRQAVLFGEQLVLERTLTTRLGSNTVRLCDTVTNEGFRAQPHMLLYHCNFGFPLIGEDAVLSVPAAQTEARDADAEAGLAQWQTFSAPTGDSREQVFRHTVTADEGGQATLTLHNRSLGKGMRLTYDTRTLPQLFQWKKLDRGSYVLGLEPANSSGIGGRAAARAAGDLPQLEAGESRQYVLEFEAFSSH